MIVRRGMGETCASRGPIPAGYLCSDASGNAVITQVGAGPSTVVDVSPSGLNTVQDWFAQNADTPLTCAQIVATGADVSGTDCAGTSSSTILLIAAAVAALAIFMGSR